MKNDRYEIDLFHNSFEYMKKIEKAIAAKLGLATLNNGPQIIRNKKGWRENEKEIKYTWITSISRSLLGWASLFAIKFNETNFREHFIRNELVQELFLFNQDGSDEIYFEIAKDPTDEIVEAFIFNPFEAGKTMTIDDVTYKVKIMAHNINTFIELNNPTTEEWKAWEKQVWKKGRELSERSGNRQMIGLFE